MDLYKFLKTKTNFKNTVHRERYYYKGRRYFVDFQIKEPDGIVLMVFIYLSIFTNFRSNLVGIETKSLGEEMQKGNAERYR